MFAFIKNARGDKRPVAAGEVLRKVVQGTVERNRWQFQYGLNTPAAVNMVILMVENTLRQDVTHGAMMVDGQKAFKNARKQAILTNFMPPFPIRTGGTV